MANPDSELVPIDYELTVWIYEGDTAPSEEEVANAIYQGCDIVATEDAVDVQRP